MSIQKLTLKQRDSLKHSNARLNIWQGSVRSGKSFSSILRFCEFILEGPKGDFILAGRTYSTIKRNIINPMIDLIGDDLKYWSGKGEINLWGRTIFIVGANDERSEAKIRGMTISGAYVDEITLIPESFFSMLLSRLSIKGAKLFGTTNPDSPHHWLKTNYLDREHELNLKQWHFTLDDNPSLDPEYVKDLKREYTGLWYKRFIDGAWVLADGAVYDMFDESLHVIQEPPGKAQYYIVGIDYGTSNPTAFSLIGYNPNLKPKYWLEREYYYDSRKQNRQKTDAEYAQDLKIFLGMIKPITIYLDPSAASFKVELSRLNLPIKDADNSVLDGIRTVSRMLMAGEFKMCSCCTNAIKEMGSYLWDSRAQKRGEDKPLKENDHILDSIRYALFTHFGGSSFDLMHFTRF